MLFRSDGDGDGDGNGGVNEGDTAVAMVLLEEGGTALEELAPTDEQPSRLDGLDDAPGDS